MIDGPRRFFLLTSSLFCLSGATGLAYEVMWFKRFSHVWGNSAIALAIVVSSFLLGLGVGAYVVGRWADRSRHQLAWYGLSEVAIGALALLVPLELTALERLGAQWYELRASSPALLTSVRFLGSLLVIGPPCFLMGGTLPLLVKQFGRADLMRSDHVGWWYGINTLGGALGAAATGFLFIPLFGLSETNLGIACVNGAIGVCALAASGSMGKRLRSGDARRPEAAAAQNSCRISIGALLFAAIASGCAALILQIVWTRQLISVLGGATYSFTAVLTIVLVGLAIGSVLADGLLARFRDVRLLAVGAIFLVVASAGASQYTLTTLTEIAGVARPLRGSVSGNALLCLAIASALQLVPCVAMGALFPLFVALAKKTYYARGAEIGRMYALNTIGTIAGGPLAALLLVPQLGTARAMAAGLLLYLAAGVALFRSRSRGATLVFAGMLLASGMLVWRSSLPRDHRILQYGQYIYGHRPRAELAERLQPLYFEEGPTCSVFVAEEPGARTMRVNGKIDASDGLDMTMQLGMAYLPLFMRPESREVFIVGYGSGSTCGAALLWPGTDVTCCEIEPAIVRAARWFRHVNHQPLDSPRFELVGDDGRSYLHGSPDKYDLILSEPSNPWIAGVSNLFTQEFYESARRRLRSRGLFVQWIQTYSFEVREFALVINTIRGVFPHCCLLRVTDADTMLIASEEPLDVDAGAIHRTNLVLRDAPEIVADLERYFGTTDPGRIILERFLFDDKALGRLVRAAGPARINTDVNLRLECDAPLRIFHPLSLPDLGLARALLEAIDPRFVVELARSLGPTPERLPALQTLHRMFLEQGLPEHANGVLAGVEGVPDGSAYSLRHRLVQAREIGSVLPQVSELVKESPAEAGALGAALWGRGRYDEAIAVFEVLSDAYPESATTWSNLAVNYQKAGRLNDARVAAERARELDACNSFVLQAWQSVRESESGGGPLK